MSDKGKYYDVLKDYNRDSLMELFLDFSEVSISHMTGQEILQEYYDGYFNEGQLIKDGWLTEEEQATPLANEHRQEIVGEYLESLENYKADATKNELTEEVLDKISYLKDEWPEWQQLLTKYKMGEKFLKDIDEFPSESKCVWMHIKQPSQNSKGWHNEPINHALAGKGIKMGRSRVRK
jgi:hypothetical protein